MATQSDPASSTSSRLALVTGASAGIGTVFCRELAREGWDLVMVARRGDRLDALAKDLENEFGIQAEVFPADLTRIDELRSVEDRLAGDGALELLVNNAGYGSSGPFAGLDVDVEDREIRLNVLALARLTHAALPGMVERGRGAIINVSSMAGFSPSPYMATYAATKAFVTSFSEALHEELAGTGVQVQALCPGVTRTEFQEVARVDQSAVPELVWTSAEEVVQASLAGLRDGSLIVVPGLANRAISTAQTLLPRGWVRRITAVMMKRAADGAKEEEAG